MISSLRWSIFPVRSFYCSGSYKLVDTFHYSNCYTSSNFRFKCKSNAIMMNDRVNNVIIKPGLPYRNAWGLFIIRWLPVKGLGMQLAISQDWSRPLRIRTLLILSNRCLSRQPFQTAAPILWGFINSIIPYHLFHFADDNLRPHHSLTPFR